MFDGQNVFDFSAGLPGLPGTLTKFVLVSLGEGSPFFFLQSLQDDKIGFILVNPFALYPEYEFELPEGEATALKVKEPGQVAVFCIVNASGGLKSATVNLLAPVVLNTVDRTARQVVLNDKRYTTRHLLSGFAGFTYAAGGDG